MNGKEQDREIKKRKKRQAGAKWGRSDDASGQGPLKAKDMRKKIGVTDVKKEGISTDVKRNNEKKMKRD